MRDFLFSQHTYQKQKRPSVEGIGRKGLPACTLFLLLYAFGVSCGMAIGADGYRAEILPSLTALLTDSTFLKTAARTLFCCFCAAGAQAAFLLLAGLSVWFLPLWVLMVFVRAMAVGVCVSLGIAVLQAGSEHAVSIVSVAAAAFLISFGAELRLGILPLVRRVIPMTDDAVYLAAGGRLALRFLSVSIFMAVASIVFLRYLVPA